MQLHQIAFVSYVFQNLTDFNNSYNQFINTTNNSPDLTIKEHQRALLKWLNQWGCRQFSLDYHDTVSIYLKEWYQKYIGYLPVESKNIWELKEKDYDLISPAYNALIKIVASEKLRGKKYIKTTVGPTGTSKIFFALRPKSLIPLDIPMRLKFKYGDDALSYIKYLKLVKDIALDLDKQCKLNGFSIKDLPEQIDRQDTTIPALIDEYHWVTITNKVKLPSKDNIKRWISWKEFDQKNNVWDKITSYLSNNKKLNLLSNSENSQIFNIVEITNDYIRIKFQETKTTLKLERDRFISAYCMLEENKGNWILLGASRVNTKPNTLEGRIKLDYNNKLNGLSTVSWIAAILEKVFDNIKFNYMQKGQALKML